MTISPPPPGSRSLSSINSPYATLSQAGAWEAQAIGRVLRPGQVNQVTMILILMMMMMMMMMMVTMIVMMMIVMMMMMMMMMIR